MSDLLSLVACGFVVLFPLQHHMPLNIVSIAGRGGGGMGGGGMGGGGGYTPGAPGTVVIDFRKSIDNCSVRWRRKSASVRWQSGTGQNYPVLSRHFVTLWNISISRVVAVSTLLVRSKTKEEEEVGHKSPRLFELFHIFSFIPCKNLSPNSPFSQIPLRTLPYQRISCNSSHARLLGLFSPKSQIFELRRLIDFRVAEVRFFIHNHNE